MGLLNRAVALKSDDYDLTQFRVVVRYPEEHGFMSARVLRCMGYELDPGVDFVCTESSDCGVLYS
jgi:hypothetical protein